MTASFTINLPDIGKRDAFHNAITYTKYEAELKRGNVLSFGIYRGKRFVLLRDSDAFLIKLHYRICRLFMLIRINQEAIEPLHKSSQIRLSKLPPIELATHIKENLENFDEQFEKDKKELEAELARKIQEEKEKAKNAFKELEERTEAAEEKLRNGLAELTAKLETAKSKGKKLKETIKTQMEEFKAKLQESEVKHEKHEPKKKHSEHTRELKKENKRLTTEVETLKEKVKALENVPVTDAQVANFADADDVFSRIKAIVDDLSKEEQKNFSKELTEKLKKAYLHHTISLHTHNHSRHSLEIPKDAIPPE